MRFLDVRTDFAFKKVFGSEQSKEILLAFLNAVLPFEDATLTDLTIVDPYQVPSILGMKDSYVDVKAILSNGTHVIIEMQVLNVAGFEQRVLYNAAKCYTSQPQAGEKYDTLEPVIAITITNFEMFPDLPHILTYWELREKESMTRYSGDISLMFIELKKFQKTVEDLTSITDKWLFFLKHAGELTYIPETMAMPPLADAFAFANQAGLSDAEMEEQDRRLDFIRMQLGALDLAEQQGLARGIKKGREEAILQVVKDLLRLHVSLDTIVTATGLSIEEIQTLNDEQ